MTFLEFLNTQSGKIIGFAALGIILIILVFMIIILINTLVKHGKKIIINTSSNKSKELENVNNPNITEDGSSDKNKIINNILNHKFFSYIKYKYVGVEYNLAFENYEMLLEHGIKKESKELVEFKKLIASHFLSDCIFKYLFDSIKKWIETVVEEYTKSEDKESIPVSLCNIIEDLVHFTKDTTHMASNVRLNFYGKVVNGIPSDFVKYFCKIVNRDISTIQDIISSIIYMNNISWYNKIVEILDFLELVIIYIKDSVDSTLIIMNGQLEKYVEELMFEK